VRCFTSRKVGAEVRPTLLIIDERKNLRMLYDHELGEEGYRVVLAENRHEALKVLKHDCPDLVILDGSILVKEGRTALEEIRSFCNKTIIVANDVDPNSCKMILSSFPLDDCLVKSSDLSHLKKKISDLLLGTP